MISWPVFYWEPDTLRAYRSTYALNCHIKDWLLEQGVQFFDSVGRKLSARTEERQGKCWWWTYTYADIVLDAPAEGSECETQEFRSILLRWLSLYGGYQGMNLEEDSMQQLIEKAIQVPGVLED